MIIGSDYQTDNTKSFLQFALQICFATRSDLNKVILHLTPGCWHNLPFRIELCDEEISLFPHNLRAFHIAKAATIRCAIRSQWNARRRYFGKWSH